METSKLTLMAVHAHPDDESSSTGGVLARYSDEGITTVVVTCTNGEYGDGPEHVKPGDDGHDPESVAKTRLAELDTATSILGVTHLETLGYHDSGMADWEYKDKDHVFARVPFDEPVAKVMALIERYQPDVLITYDDNAGYNHPDHLRAHYVAVEAFRQTGIPKKLYFIARRRRDWEAIRARLQEAGIEVPLPAQQRDPEVLKRLEEREKLITTTVDVSSVITRKRDALGVHASQLDRSWWVLFPEENLPEMMGNETFIRAEDRTGAPVPEDDLFAGLRD